MSACRFYGRNGMFGRLLDTHGNQCALIRTSHAPCARELAGQPVDEITCPLVRETAADADAAQRLLEFRQS